MAVQAVANAQTMTAAADPTRVPPARFPICSGVRAVMRVCRSRQADCPLRSSVALNPISTPAGLPCRVMAISFSPPQEGTWKDRAAKAMSAIEGDRPAAISRMAASTIAFRVRFRCATRLDPPARTRLGFA
jgi:hypothetical protein